MSVADNYKNGIPVEELVLGNGDTAIFYKYLTTGESRELQRILLEGGKFNVSNITEGKLNDISSTVVFDYQDKAADFLIKEIKRENGTVESYSKDWLYRLPLEYGNKVYDRINQLIQGSQPAPKEKKV